jgi:hypothetical protein
VENFSETLTWNTVYILGSGNYQYTIKTLKNFVNIDTIVDIPSPLFSQQYTGTDILLVIGNSYIDQLVMKPFSYYK